MTTLRELTCPSLASSAWLALAHKAGFRTRFGYLCLCRTVALTLRPTSIKRFEELHRLRIFIIFAIELGPNGDLVEYPFQAQVAVQKHGLSCTQAPPCVRDDETTVQEQTRRKPAQGMEYKDRTVGVLQVSQQTQEPQNSGRKECFTTYMPPRDHSS
jgi:hypothetical protein